MKPGTRVTSTIDGDKGTVVATPDGWRLFNDETCVVWDGDLDVAVSPTVTVRVLEDVA